MEPKLQDRRSDRAAGFSFCFSFSFKILGIMTIEEHISNEEILVLRERSGFAFGNTVL